MESLHERARKRRQASKSTTIYIVLSSQRRCQARFDLKLTHRSLGNLLHQLVSHGIAGLTQPLLPEMGVTVARVILLLLKGYPGTTVKSSKNSTLIGPSTISVKNGANVPG